MSELSAEQRLAWEQWLADRPPAVRAVAEKYPGFTCYRSSENRGHYAILSYDEPEGSAPITVQIAHGADSYSPGIAVFGVDPDTLVRCDCGKWEWPTEEQADQIHEAIEAFKEVVDAAGLKILPGVRLVPKEERSH